MTYLNLKNTTRILAAATLLTVAACGSDAPFCGDKQLDMGEECDDGNSDDTDFCLSTCKARQLSQLTVKWEFNQGEAEGFSSDSCIDVGASNVEVELVGGPEPLLLSERCSFRQVVFVDLPAADYEVRTRVLDSEGELLTAGVVTEDFSFDGGTDTLELSVPFASWTRSYDGTFYFRVAWDAEDCDAADPVVAEQRLTLVVGGQTFTGTTTDGTALNGTATGVCQSVASEFPQSALDVPAGPADIRIEGLDGEGSVVFQEDFATFVGAGVNNPELLFDVDAVTLPP